MAAKHDCRAVGKDGELLFICSRCGGCYVCRHKAILFEDGTWHWKCKDGKIQEVILDGRIKA